MPSADTRAIMDALQLEVGKAIGTPEFDGLASRYSALSVKFSDEVKAENSGKINEIKTLLGTSVHKLLNDTKLGDLLGEPIWRVVWTLTAYEGDKPDTVAVMVNPNRITKTAKNVSANTPKPNGNGNGGNGTQRSLIAIFEQHATAEEREKMNQIEEKYGPEPNTEQKKLMNSNLWSLKNKVAKRVQDEAEPQLSVAEAGKVDKSN